MVKIILKQVFIKVLKFFLSCFFVLGFLIGESLASNKNSGDLLKDVRDKLNLDGRIMIDSGNVIKGKNSKLKDELSIRRAWLGTSGKFNDDWFYRGLFGFEDEDISLVDVFVGYKGIKNSEILVGNLVENSGLDGYTANLVSPFMERSDAFTTFRRMRRLGISYNYYHDNKIATRLGFFGSGVGDNAKLVDKGESVSGRIYGLAFNDEEKYHNLHLGFNFSYRNPQSQNRGLRYQSVGNANVLETNILDSGFIRQVDDYQNYGLEARYQKGSFSAIGEYFKTVVNRKTSNLNFDSAYVQMSYFVTGHKYRYNFNLGGLTEVVDQKGAVELAARYSKVDLNYRDVVGGKSNSYDLGINYYVNNNVKLMLNYIYSDLQNSPITEDNIQYLMTRLQVWF